MLPSRARVARIRLPVECRQGGLAAGVEGGKCASAISTEYVFYGTIKPESPRCILFSTVHCDGAWVAGGRLLGPGRLRVGVDALAVLLLHVLRLPPRPSCCGLLTVPCVILLLGQ